MAFNDERRPLVSVLVLSYRRLHLLRRTIESFRRVTLYPRLEFVLADDGSPTELQEEMRRLPFDVFVMSTHNRGLGANSNAGLAACTGDYVLQLQDDWECRGRSDYLDVAVDIMEQHTEIGLMRFTDRDSKLLYRTYSTASGHLYRVYPHDQRRPRGGLFLYTDTPHIKSRACIETLGQYLEGCPMQLSEIDMRERFLAQAQYSAGHVEGTAVFHHIGEADSHRRPLLKERVGRWLLARSLSRPLMISYLRIRDEIHDLKWRRPRL